MFSTPVERITTSGAQLTSNLLQPCRPNDFEESLPTTSYAANVSHVLSKSILQPLDMTTAMAYVGTAARVDEVKHSSTSSDETRKPSARKPRQRKISVSDLPEIEHTLISKIDLYQPQKDTIIRTRTDILRFRMDLEYVYERYAAVKTTYRRKIASLRKLIKERSEEYDQALWEVKHHVQEDTNEGTDEDHQSAESQCSTATDTPSLWHEEEDLERKVTSPLTKNDQLQHQIAESDAIIEKLKKLSVGVRNPAPRRQANRTADQESEVDHEFRSVPRSRRNHIDHRTVQISDRRDIVCFKCKKKGHIKRECRTPPTQESK